MKGVQIEKLCNLKSTKQTEHTIAGSLSQMEVLNGVIALGRKDSLYLSLSAAGQ